MFFLFQGLLLFIVEYITQVTNNDVLYSELPEWAKEFDYFETGLHETIDLTAIEGTDCLK
jgi:hypothetical protein